MRFYIDITLLPNTDIGHHFLWEKVFQQLHIGLVSTQALDGSSLVGIALPEYNAEKFQLGSKLRLLSSETNLLERLDADKCLNRLSDYVHITSIRPVPDSLTGHSFYKRQQPKSSTERMARRKAKREGISLEEAQHKLDGRKNVYVRTPFINMKSQTTGQRFCLFIDKISVDKPIVGDFSSYGLSNGATVPEF